MNIFSSQVILQVLVSLATLAISGVSGFAADQVAPTSAQPNIIIILADDLGYGDLGSYGATSIATPHLDQLAAEGLRMTDFYAAASVCTASRAALLTGCYPERVGNLRVLHPRHRIGLNPDEVTIADMLKGAGYATALIGKWHLGHHEPFLPTNQGFDMFYGIPYSNDMGPDPALELAEQVVWRDGQSRETFLAVNPQKSKKFGPPLMKGTQVIEQPADQTTLTQRYTEQAVDFISNNHQQPFFLYVAHAMPHIPLYASDEFRGTSEAGLYGDTVEELDASVGAIIATLRELDLDQNTLVIFSSDNGPLHRDHNHESKVKGNMGRNVGGDPGPLRGAKFSDWDGGLRVPGLFWWPGRIPAGAVSSGVSGSIDLLPTISHYTGADLPERAIDGKNIASLLEQHDGAESPHEAIYLQSNGVRMGDWKLLVPRRNPGVKGPEETSLFNLEQDIGEQTNLIQEHPEVAETLSTMLTDFHAQMAAEGRPVGALPGEE